MSEALRPLFVTVTWGAGGTTSKHSLQLAHYCQSVLDLTTVLHLTCTNMSRQLIDEALTSAREAGIRNILALRGDPPRSAEYSATPTTPTTPTSPDATATDDSNHDFTHAVDLVRYIREKHGDYFAIGVAAYPEGHANESHPADQSLARDLPYLVDKVRAGADFILTQLTYDVAAYERFEAVLRDHESGVFQHIPIVPGLLPIQSYTNLTRVTNLSHVRVPPQILQKFTNAKADDDAVRKIGVDVVSDIIERLKSLPTRRSPAATDVPRGFHFYTLNLEKVVTTIIKACGLIPAIPDDRNGAVTTNENARSPEEQQQQQQQTEHDSRNHLDPNRASVLHISEGLGTLGRQVNWDDYPNGRWGDSRSPAYGEIDGYGPSLHVSADESKRLWGFPTSSGDIDDIFRRHVAGQLSAVPWSEGGAEAGGEALSAETAVIRGELLELINGRGWWTLASQPAVNGTGSEDPVFGWGPPGEGFVFQKPFVEFFCSKQSYRDVLLPLFEKFGSTELSWFSVNSNGNFASSSSLSSSSDPLAAPSATSTPTSANGTPSSAQREKFSLSPARSNSTAYSSTFASAYQHTDVVTWGVFRGREIITPTIIEEASFRAWGEEAFRIWDQWRQVFPPNSATERTLRDVKDDVYLVCVVGHKYGAGTEDAESEEAEKRRFWRLLTGEISS